MQFLTAFTCGILLAAAVEAQPPTPIVTPPAPPPPPPVMVKTPEGLPPRTAPTEYSGHDQAGDLIIAGDFLGHSLPTGSGLLKSEDFVAVEAAVFGPAGAHGTISHEQFTLKINGKKALEAQPFEFIAGSIKDPEYAPPETKAKAGGISAGGNEGGGGGSEPPPPPRVPPEVKRANEQRVKKTIMLEGDRALPIAGILFFRYGGQEKGIHQVELIYNGPAGKAKLELQ